MTGRARPISPYEVELSPKEMAKLHVLMAKALVRWRLRNRGAHLLLPLIPAALVGSAARTVGFLPTLAFVFVVSALVLTVVAFRAHRKLREADLTSASFLPFLWSHLLASVVVALGALPIALAAALISMALIVGVAIVLGAVVMFFALSFLRALLSSGEKD